MLMIHLDGNYGCNKYNSLLFEWLNNEFSKYNSASGQSFYGHCFGFGITHFLETKISMQHI